MELGRRLQKYRENAKVTQKQMADACGCSKNYLSAVERGINKVNVSVLTGYARTLGMSLDELAGFETKGEILPELRTALYEMDEDQQRKVLQMIELMMR